MNNTFLAIGAVVIIFTMLSNNGLLVPLFIAVFGVGIAIYIIKLIYDIYKQKEIRKQYQKECKNLLNTIKLLNFNDDYIKFNGSCFNNNKKLKWNEITGIKLVGHHIHKTTEFTGITKKDGSPDWRYRHDKSEWVDKYSTTFEIYFYIGQKKIDTTYFDKNFSISKNSIENNLKKYNIFIEKLKHPIRAKAYKRLFDINDSCKINKAILHSLELEIQEKEKLSPLSVDQLVKLTNLKELKDKIDNFADKYKVEEEKFVKIYNNHIIQENIS